MGRVSKMIDSFKFALHGVWYIVRKEQNFQIDLIAATVVVILMIIFELSTLEYVALSGSIVAVMIMEIINTVFERMVDVLKPRVHPYAKTMKDMMAAAVLITAVGAFVVGLFILGPHFLDLF